MIIIRIFVISIWILAFLNHGGYLRAQQLEVNILEGGTDTLDFGNIRTVDQDGNPKVASVTRRVLIKVDNPTANRYQVIQRLDNPFLSPKGEALAAGALKFYVDGAQKQGIMGPTSLEPVAIGDRIIYTSDNSGSADQFFINYLLEVKDVLSKGRYQTNIAYSITER